MCTRLLFACTYICQALGESIFLNPLALLTDHRTVDMAEANFRLKFVRRRALADALQHHVHISTPRKAGGDAPTTPHAALKYVPHHETEAVCMASNVQWAELGLD